jgi:hypothetical protein
MPQADAVHAAPTGGPVGPTRRDPAWLWLLAAALLVARVVTGLIEDKHPPKRADLMPWVPAAEVFADAKLTAALGQFVVPVHVVDRQQEEGHNPALVDSLQRAHKVTAFPTLVIVGADGQAVDRMEGFEGAQPMVQWVSRNAMKARLGAKTGTPLLFP